MPKYKAHNFVADVKRGRLKWSLLMITLDRIRVAKKIFENKPKV
jgi:hypothetical protein